MALEQLGEEANGVGHCGPVERRQPGGLPGLCGFVCTGSQRELQIRVFRLKAHGFAPIFQGGIISFAVQENLRQPIQCADQLRVCVERLAKLGFGLSRVHQHGAQRTTGLQQSGIRLEGQPELFGCGCGLLLALPDEPEIEMSLRRARLQPQRLFERRYCTFEVALFGEPCALASYTLAGGVPAGGCAADAGGLQASGSCARAVDVVATNSRSPPQPRRNRFMMAANIIPPRSAMLSLAAGAWLCHFHHAIGGHIMQ